MNDAEWADLRQNMLRFAIARCGPENADDIVQNVIARYLAHDRGHIDNLIGYLIQGVKNEVATFWKKKSGRRRMQRRCELPEPPSIEQHVSDREELAALLDKLGPEIVSLLATYYDDGGEVAAQRVGIKAQHLRVLVNGVRATLRGQPSYHQRGRINQLKRLVERAAA